MGLVESESKSAVDSSPRDPQAGNLWRSVVGEVFAAQVEQPGAGDLIAQLQIEVEGIADSLRALVIEAGPAIDTLSPEGKRYRGELPLSPESGDMFRRARQGFVGIEIFAAAVGVIDARGQSLAPAGAGLGFEPVDAGVGHVYGAIEAGR